jgi:hypothetical protein
MDQVTNSRKAGGVTMAYELKGVEVDRHEIVDGAGDIVATAWELNDGIALVKAANLLPELAEMLKRNHTLLDSILTWMPIDAHSRQTITDAVNAIELLLARV